MRIGIDINEANVEHRVGSNQYAYEIINALYKQNQNDSFTLYASRPIQPDLPKSNEWWQYKVIPPAALWTQWRLPLELVRDVKKLDVFFTPGHYAPRYSPVPYAMSVMDLAFITMPQYFKTKDLLKLKKWTHYSVKNASKVIAISESTKKDIMTYYQKHDDEVVVAYPGYSPTQTHAKMPLPNTITRPYILFVGTLQPRKNLTRLIEAHQKMTADIQLVLAGKTGWLANGIFNAIAHSTKQSKIITLGYTDQNLLTSLYQQAACVVMPGLYEGFGIPALEAIHHKALPVVANTGSLPEIVVCPELLFDPYDVDSIAQTLQTAIQLTPNTKQKLLEKLTINAAKFSWQESAKQIRSTFNDIAIS